MLKEPSPDHVVWLDGNFVRWRESSGIPRSEILVTSSSGLAVLGCNTSFFGLGCTSLTVASNGTRLGGWLLNTNANHIGRIGDVNGNLQDDIVIHWRVKSIMKASSKDVGRRRTSLNLRETIAKIMTELKRRGYIRREMNRLTILKALPRRLCVKRLDRIARSSDGE